MHEPIVALDSIPTNCHTTCDPARLVFVLVVPIHPSTINTSSSISTSMNRWRIIKSSTIGSIYTKCKSYVIQVNLLAARLNLEEKLAEIYVKHPEVTRQKGWRGRTKGSRHGVVVKVLERLGRSVRGQITAVRMTKQRRKRVAFITFPTVPTTTSTEPLPRTTLVDLLSSPVRKILQFLAIFWPEQVC